MLLIISKYNILLQNILFPSYVLDLQYRTEASSVPTNLKNVYKVNIKETLYLCRVFRDKT